MKYPVLAEKEALRLSSQRISGDMPRIEATIKGSGNTFNENEIKNLTAALKEELGDPVHEKWEGNKDAFEGHIAFRVYTALRSTPIPVLDDPGFWRYLSLKYFWWYSEWRQPSAFSIGGAYKNYVDGRNAANSIPLRIYLRGQIASEAGNGDLASALPEATDFWRSHITRVKTWRYPTVVNAFIQTHMANQMRTDKLRTFAKILGRRRANIVFTSYTEEESANLVGEIRLPLDKES